MDYDLNAKKVSKINLCERDSDYFLKAAEFFKKNKEEVIVKVKLRNKWSFITRFETEVYTSFEDKDAQKWYTMFKIHEKDLSQSDIELGIEYILSLYEISFDENFKLECTISEMSENVKKIYNEIPEFCEKAHFGDPNSIQSMYLLIEYLELKYEKEKKPRELSIFFEKVYQAILNGKKENITTFS